ncbi:MAG TPA: hypothetical protein VLE51_02240 [Candidatus Saccharimonadales bacterium]|nr:hypothetical protein [Candidatus Saccharimonadales bacterium]
MVESGLVDLLALYHSDREVPSDVFVVRRNSDLLELRTTIGDLLVQKFISLQGEGVPRNRPTYRMEAVEPVRLQELAHDLGIEATQPEEIVKEMREGEVIAIHEVGQNLGGAGLFGEEEGFFRSA